MYFISSRRNKLFSGASHFLTILMIVLLVIAGGCQYVPSFSKLQTPGLLVQLPDYCPTPDGMVLDKVTGDIIVACPNYADQTKPAVLIRVSPDNKVTKLCEVPVLKETGVACPMGIDMADNGDLYIADNQGWAKPNDLGRILCLKMKDGKMVGHEVVAYGMTHPNGLKVKDGYIYVTQSMLSGVDKSPLVSAVYRFNIKARNVKVNNTLNDKNLLVAYKTFNMDCQYGLDGLVFDSKGNLFVGNFGDGTLHKITFDAAGKVMSNTLFAVDKCMRTTDGICVDDQDNIYVADFSSNAVCKVTPDGKVSLMAKSPDCDGSKGGLDQPGEPIVRGNELIVTCFDKVTGPDKVNTKHDWPYTMSVLKLNAK